MNYETFQTYMEVFHFEEVKIIGKDLCLDGEWIHVVGMGRKKEGTFFYILEEQPALEERPVWRQNQTKRESMLESADRHDGNALHIRSIKIGEDLFEFQGGTGGNQAQAESAEAYFFFQQMIENGWRIPEDSCFYRLEWNCMGLVALHLKDSDERLPVLAGEIEQVTLGPTHKSYIIQRPVRLERGKTSQLSFSLEEGGEEMICYINSVDMTEPLIEEQERFNDAQYQERVLQHISRDEFEEMKKMALESIEADCPKGMGYFTVEYECTKENLNAQFFVTADLDSISKPKKGCTSMIIMGGKPEQEIGPHGFRNRCTVVQYAVPVETKTLEAELFMMTETIQEKELKF